MPPPARSAVLSERPVINPVTLPGLRLWLRADSLALNDGDSVQTWSDQSGLGNHLTQATAGKRPLLKKTILNGHPVVRFDGTDDVLRAAANTFLNAPAQLSVFVVMKSEIVALQMTLSKSDTAASGTGWRLYHSGTIDGNIIFRAAWGVPNGTLGVNTDWRIIDAYYASGDQRVYINGLEVATGTSSTPAASNTGLFSVGGSTVDTLYLTGDIAEIIITESAPLSNRRAVETYLGKRYRIAIQ
jgi:hypothetical protein